MKKLLAVATIAAVVPLFAAVESPNIVGYNTKTLGSNFNWLCNTFIPTSGNKDALTLGDITVDTEVWSDSQINILNANGGVKKFVHAGLGMEVFETYVYWPKANKTDAGVAGWYLIQDEDAAYPMNDKQFTLGESYCVTCVAGEEGATMTFSGQVYTNTVSFTLGGNFNWLGNCAPATITLGDIAVDTDVWSDSQINILNANGGVKKFVHEGLGIQVFETYVYWPKASKTDAGVAGWYLYQDEDAAYPMNDKVIGASESFCVTCVSGEEGCTFTLPSAL